MTPNQVSRLAKNALAALGDSVVKELSEEVATIAAY